MRLIAIDFGRKRIGLAACDETETVITPLKQLDFTHKSFWPNLEAVLNAKKPQKIILGYPYRDDGAEVTLDKELREFRMHLLKIVEVEVEFVNEGFTSKIANEVWLQTRNMNSAKKKKEKRMRLDSIAAAVILDAYINQN